MVPYLIYFSTSKWVYPMKDFIGETGCYLMVLSRGVLFFEVKLGSFFMAFFRYICLIDDRFLTKNNLTPYVSNLEVWEQEGCGINLKSVSLCRAARPFQNMVRTKPTCYIANANLQDLFLNLAQTSLTWLGLVCGTLLDLKTWLELVLVSSHGLAVLLWQQST